MPIKRLGTHVMSYGSSARLGFLKKGAPKGEKRPGEDLDHYRFDPKIYPEKLSEIFFEAYGPTPRTIRVRLAYDTALEALPNWVECRKGKTLLWRGDGETVTTWLEDGKYHHGSRPQSDFNDDYSLKNAKETGHLVVYIPELVKAGYDGVVWALTKSAHDITTLWERLRHYERMSRGNLTGIEFALTRVLKPVTDHATGHTRDMWLMELTSDAEWMALQLANRKRETYAIASGGGLMGLPSGAQAVDHDTGEILPEYALPSGDEVVTVSSPSPSPVIDVEPEPAKKVLMPTPKDKKYFSETMQALYGEKWETEEPKVIDYAKTKKPASNQPDGLTREQMRYANSLLKGKMNKINDVSFLVDHIAKFTGFDSTMIDTCVRNLANDDTITAPIPVIYAISSCDEFGDDQIAAVVAQVMEQAKQEGIPF